MTRKLSLRVDPPYQGESLSSFLERTAQFYGMSFADLCMDLGWPGFSESKAWNDIDFNPPLRVLERLAESVSGWHSPFDEHQGFNSVVIGQSWRHAYCPRCFLDDLSQGITPYFRNDWAPFFVSTCWRHGSLLLSWHDVDARGRRRFPKEWLFRFGDFANQGPKFFWVHLEWLRRLQHPEAYGYGLNAGQVSRYLIRLQWMVEKRSETPMASGRSDLQEPLRLDARRLAEFAVCEIWGVDAPYGHGHVRSYGWNSLRWMPAREAVRSTRGPPPVKALRRSSDARWRRNCLLFVARTLAGTAAYGPWLSDQPDKEPPWREWWDREVMWFLGRHHQLVIRRHMAGELGRHLDDVPALT